MSLPEELNQQKTLHQILLKLETEILQFSLNLKHLEQPYIADQPGMHVPNTIHG